MNQIRYKLRFLLGCTGILLICFGFLFAVQSPRRASQGARIGQEGAAWSGSAGGTGERVQPHEKQQTGLDMRERKFLMVGIPLLFLGFYLEGVSRARRRNRGEEERESLPDQAEEGSVLVFSD